MKKLILVLLLISVTGCFNKEKYTHKVEMICDGVITSFDVKDGNTISCNTYEFKVKKVKRDKIEIKSNIAVDSKVDFEFSNDKELELKISENNSIILRWKE